MDLVLYADVNDPYGIGLLTLNEDPEFLCRSIKRIPRYDSSFMEFTPKPELTMLGRTYASRL